MYGATGPSSYDCSGLVQAAWAAAGVAIPRTTFEDWDGLPHIPVSQMVPGDLIIYDGEGHVAIYVGDGYIIDAPHTGAVVERVPYDESVVRRQRGRRPPALIARARGALPRGHPSRAGTVRPTVWTVAN